MGNRQVRNYLVRDLAESAVLAERLHVDWEFTRVQR